MQVPFRFWSEAILTACYLINRMHSRVLNGKSPFFFYFRILFHLVPRVFGCVAFENVLHPTPVRSLIIGPFHVSFLVTLLARKGTSVFIQKMVLYIFSWMSLLLSMFLICQTKGSYFVMVASRRGISVVMREADHKWFFPLKIE